MRILQGLQETIRQGKTDQEGRGHVIAILRGSRLRPVRAVQDWLDAAGITDGPVFRSINRHGRVSAAALSAQSVALVVKRCAETVGLDPDEFAGHSPRRGFLTSAAEADADVLRMMEVSRHRRAETVRECVRRPNLFRGTPGRDPMVRPLSFLTRAVSVHGLPIQHQRQRQHAPGSRRIPFPICRTYRPCCVQLRLGDHDRLGQPTLHPRRTAPNHTRRDR